MNALCILKCIVTNRISYLCLSGYLKTFYNKKYTVYSKKNIFQNHQNAWWMTMVRYNSYLNPNVSRGIWLFIYKISNMNGRNTILAQNNKTWDTINAPISGDCEYNHHACAFYEPIFACGSHNPINLLQKPSKCNKAFGKTIYVVTTALH